MPAPEALRQAAQDAQAAAREVVKDAGALSRQSSALREDARHAREDSRNSPRRAAPAAPLTVPEAARSLCISERVLRRALAEPGLSARLVERTRKIGIYYKTLPLVPLDLLADLSVRLSPGPPHDTP